MIHTLLKNKKVVLASASPRRKQIFEYIGVKALQYPANIDEPMLELPPYKLVQELALMKASHVATHVDSGCLIVGADTIVYSEKEILGKPDTIGDAIEYLTRLSGHTHSVYTGVAIKHGVHEFTSYAKSSVTFKTLDMHDIEAYIKTKEPFDKAGAYGIQGYGSQFIEKIAGCYFNVMGFPISTFYDMLKDMKKKKLI
ncbi:MAG: Maf family protein [Candidatus Zophobacter franzmannii]|nr:Maf family protein [Candidatus Zophobacter franzmannii]